MAKLVVAMNQSLDGYVDHVAFGPPRPGLFRHYIEYVRGLIARPAWRMRRCVLSRSDRATDVAAASSGENLQTGAFANPTVRRFARSALMAGADRPTARFGG